GTCSIRARRNRSNKPYADRSRRRTRNRYLKGEGEYSERSQYAFPRLLILDIKMPRLNGFEVLSWIRDHPECAVIPVIMMSSSRDERDITKAYQLGANSYM